MGWVGGRAGSYLAVCGTDWDADVGSQHHCECRGQFNSESTVEGGGKRRGGEEEEGVVWGRGRVGGQRDIVHCIVLEVLLMARPVSIRIDHGEAGMR